MRNDTRRLYTAYEAEIAKLNGVDRVDRKFSVQPSVQQRLETKVQESSEFLGKINVHGVVDQEGEKIGLGVSGPVAGTTDTSVKDRQTSDIATLDGRKYRCEQTNSDTHITYQRLDAWAKFPDFQTRIRDAILRRQALDRIMIGFNGIARAATSDRAANPMLQDVKKAGCSTCAKKRKSASCPRARPLARSWSAARTPTQRVTTPASTRWSSTWSTT